MIPGYFPGNKIVRKNVIICLDCFYLKRSKDLGTCNHIYQAKEETQVTKNKLCKIHSNIEKNAHN